MRGATQVASVFGLAAVLLVIAASERLAQHSNINLQGQSSPSPTQASTGGFDRFEDIPLPPYGPPSTTLDVMDSPGADRDLTVQEGRLIGSMWLTAGTPVVDRPTEQVDWPTSMPVSSKTLTVRVGTPSSPVHVRLLLYSQMRPRLGPADFEFDCFQPGWEFNGSPPACTIQYAVDGDAILLPFELPASGEWFIVVEGIWLVPGDDRMEGEELMPMLRAWWAFSVYASTT